MKARPSRPNRWGTIFLVAAAGGFAAVTLVPWADFGALRYLRAFFEASLVGALADWFAVTALFKKPLGLPLPHTDILVRRKDQLVEALPRFLGTFLVPETLHPILRGVDWAALVLDKVEPATLDELVQEGLRPLLSDANPTRSAWEQRAIGVAAALVHRELTAHRDALVGPVTEIIKRNAGWKGLFIGRDTVDEAVEGFLEELRAVRDRPEHPLRRNLARAFREALPRFLDELKPSRWTTETWKRLESDEGFRSAFNTRAGDLAVALWERTDAAGALTGALGYLLGQTDARSLADRIEGSVSRDLQYIRVNGALVGGLAGLGLEFVRSWVGR
jgi:uncharacterized membrane-anchored protein YjiN (DUF445 family)